jgi:exopolysaccharide biosynthesis polyprenyl glycosylphosphotransferase
MVFKGLNLTPKFKLLILTIDFAIISATLAFFYSWRTGNDWNPLLTDANYWGQLVLPLALNYLFGSYDLDKSKFYQIAVSVLLSSVLAVVFFTVINFLFYQDRSGLYGRGVLVGSQAVFVFFTLLLKNGIWQLVQSQQAKAKLLFWVNEKDKEFLLSDIKKKKLKINYKLITELDEISLSELKKPGSTLIIGIGTSEVPTNLQSDLFDLKLQGLQILSLSDFYELTWANIPVYHLDLNWFIQSDGFDVVASQLKARIKRLFDVLFSLILLIISFPFLIVAMILIKIDSSGPIFYRQIRVGKRGNKITITKLRSMRTDAEASGAQWAKKNDSRITRVGRFLRKTRIDELPQLLNVLKGDMSFIGPRPERPEFVTELENQIPFYQMRHMVRPGLTGWAQVCYPYGASVEDAKEKLQYEIYYIKHHSLWLDFLILLRTVKVVLRMGGN